MVRLIDCTHLSTRQFKEFELQASHSHDIVERDCDARQPDSMFVSIRCIVGIASHNVRCSDVVDVMVSHSRDRWPIHIGLGLLVLGLLIFIIFIATTNAGVAVGFAVVPVAAGAILVGNYVITEAMRNGDDLSIDVCKYVRIENVSS